MTVLSSDPLPSDHPDDLVAVNVENGASNNVKHTHMETLPTDEEQAKEEEGEDEAHIKEDNKKDEADTKDDNNDDNHTYRFPLPDDDDFDVDQAHVRLVINEWAGGTSVHGVANVADFLTWTLWKRLMWLALICVSASLMVWQIAALIREYRAYDVITDTETIVPGYLEFPEVTVCSTNMFSQFRKEIFDIDTPRNHSEALLISKSVDSFIVDTTWNNVDLTGPATDYWRPTWTDNGLCWYFRPNATDPQVSNMNIFRPGLYGGLEVAVLLDQDDFEINGTELAGVLVYTQQPGTQITDQLPFVTVNPGKQAVIKIRKTTFVREREAPWARCFSQAPNYTQASCKFQCLAAQLRQECNCRTLGDLEGDENIPLCASDEEADCVDTFYNQEDVYLQNCTHCRLPPCEQITYDASVTDFSYANTLLDDLEGMFNLSSKWVTDNIVILSMNFDKIEFELLTESKAVTSAQLLGSIGGSMGLFLGISILSVFEVLGDLLALRLVPRFFGFRNMYGLGAQSTSSTSG